jgi:two-component system sensor histidine kinase QseC
MRTRLFAILILITGLVWLSAVAWIFFSTGAQLERVLDARLMEAARMVNSMVSKRALGAGEDASIPSVEMETHEAYNRQLSCQIWSLEGTLLSQSEGAPETRLSEHAEGFSNTVINGETWRVYTVDNPQAGVRVMVGDRVYFRDHLVNSVIFGVLLPALLILPVLAGLIWLSVGRGLTPLSRIARELSMRPASDLHPIDAGGAASELQPVVKALNALFRRVSDARERERDFIAFAAHELRRWPLPAVIRRFSKTRCRRSSWVWIAPAGWSGSCWILPRWKPAVRPWLRKPSMPGALYSRWLMSW